MRALDLVGRQFGMLTVTERSWPNSKANKARYHCLCQCGRIVEHVTGGNLIQGISTNCGCVRMEKLKKGVGRRLPRGEAAKHSLLKSYKIAAKNRDIGWNLPDQDFYRLVEDDCHYCGQMPFQQHKTTGSMCYYNGVDRMDSRKGYYLDNVVTACGTCNKAKMVMGYQEFLEWVSMVYAHRCHLSYLDGEKDYLLALGLVD